MSRIFDCFMFYNEFDILDIRLNELSESVDFFVISEANTTFQGQSKPLFFHENRARYQKFLPKIIHLVFDGQYEAPSPWHREFGQRNLIQQGIRQSREEDIIIISDVDEIPRISTVDEIKVNPRFSYMHMDTYFFYLNWISNITWKMPYIAPASYVRNHIPNLNDPRFKHETYLSDHGLDPNSNIISNAGWHLSWMGGAEKVLLKMKSFSHVEPEALIYVDPQKIQDSFKDRSFFGLHDLKVVPLSGLPDFVIKNEQSFREAGLIA